MEKYDRKKLTQEKLKELLHYDPDTGIFTWKVSRSNVRAGDVAGCMSPRGYWKIKLFNTSWFAHRLAWLYMEGYMPEQCVDHIDRDPGNNKWDNLREASFLCNTRNQNVNKSNKTGVSGVCFHKAVQKWYAEIPIRQKRYYLGVYKKFEDAVMARYKAEVEWGFLDCNSRSSAFLYLKEHNLL